MNKRTLRYASPVLIAAVVGTAFIVNAGQLAPPAGAITATGPTAINGADWNNNLPVIISQPGSYVLTSNIQAPTGYTGNGIFIDADNVTLDLNGFAVIGVAGSADGITSVYTERVVIRNGYVQSWGQYGIRAESTVARIERVVVSRNGGWGIWNEEGAADFASHIISCEALFNGGLVSGTGGIRCASQGIVVDSIAKGNSGVGISAGSVVTGCLAIGNSDDGIRGYGSSITRCVASFNGGDGIETGDSLVKGNSSTDNGGLAINDFGDSIIVDNNT
jgi:hypothetical protein